MINVVARRERECLAHHGLKECPRCGDVLPRSEFHRASKTWDKLHPCCKECHETARVRRSYGIDLTEYRAHLASPCDICGAESSHLDHNHETGRVRGGLCSACNTGIGLMSDDPKRLLQAVAYLLKVVD